LKLTFIVIYLFISAVSAAQTNHNQKLQSAINDYTNRKYTKSAGNLARCLADNEFKGEDLILANLYLGLSNYSLNKKYLARTYFEEVLRLQPGFELNDINHNRAVLDIFNSLRSSILSTVNISSLPEGAEIYINKKKIGISPIEHKSMTPGFYDVIALKPGYEAVSSSFQLHSNDTINVTLDLKEESPTGTVIIESNPGNASVFINDEFKGYSQAIISGLQPGSYKLSVKKSGYYTREDEINIEESTIKKIDLELEKEDYPFFLTGFCPGLGQLMYGYKKHSIAFTSLTAAYALFYYFRMRAPDPSANFPDLYYERTGEEESEFYIDGNRVGEWLFVREFYRQDEEKHRYDRKRHITYMIGGALFFLNFIDNVLIIRHDIKRKKDREYKKFSLHFDAGLTDYKVYLSYKF